MNTEMKSVSADSQKLLFKLRIPIEEWKRYLTQASVVCSKGRTRRKMRAEFHDFLAIQAQKRGVKCWLKVRFNYIQQKPEWRGIYKCKHLTCPTLYTAVVDEV